MRYLALTLITLTMLSACADLIPFPSGQLEGTLTVVPADWSELKQNEIIQFESNPSEPYSVNLWIIGMGDVAYVHAGTNRATWVEHIEVDPNVRLKVGNNIYELKAVRVETQEEFDALSDVYEVKYGNRPRNENVDEAYLFKLVKRG